jgi:lipopolysaccharide/colanic/teichoic acid biosynthesis glycosyltransferase
LAVDLIALAVAGVTAVALRGNATLEAADLRALLPYLLASTAVALPVSLALGLDRAFWRFSALSDFIRVVAWVLLTVVSATVIIFLFNRLEGISRSVPILHALIAVCLLVGTRITIRARHLAMNRTPDPKSITQPGATARDDCVLIVGMNNLTWLFLRALSELDQDNVRIAGIVATTPSGSRQTVRGHRILGPDVSLTEIIRDLKVHGMAVNRIIVTVDPATLQGEFADTLKSIDGQGSIRVEHLFDLIGLGSRSTPPGPSRAVDLTGSPPATRSPSPIAAADLTVLARKPYWKLKRAGDLVTAFLLLVVLSPLILVVACAVGALIGRPLIFWQDRPGRGGRRFKLYKFRTMGPAYGPDGRPIADEQRLQSLGRFLRATRLDELPQLWNILIGDMSFVGPRPLLIADQIKGETLRLLVRPGLTGWAQIMGGRAVSAEDKMALDAWYVRNASLRLDFTIIMKTVPIVIGGERVTIDAVRAWQAAAESARPPQDGQVSKI